MASRIPCTYESVLTTDIPLKVMLNALPSKGRLVYEYNPFRNYRLTKNKYLYKNNYYTIEELNKEFKIYPYYLDGSTKVKWDIKDSSKIPVGWINNLGNEVTEDAPQLFEKGLLIDFVTEELKFSLEHPVSIIPQYSYDGSVNLIINDGLNMPRLINSRFSATGRNTYEIVDRKGSNDTNIYDLGELFDIDTSLYKIVNSIPQITFLGTPAGGNLKVGNYHFYFKLSDTDGNETDFVAESGLVSVFIGHGSYNSVHTGNKNENSAKLVEFKLDNIDAAYDYINVYYSRYTAENSDNAVYEYKKILKKYSRTSPKLIITGFEDTEDITVSDINLHYNVVDAVHTSAVCQNMLFMGNVKKLNIPYEELLDLSLRILPFLGREPYKAELDLDYNCLNYKESYIDPKFIYNKTGYWKDELYRFGIVYILPNGQLTPVFNVRGGIGIGGALILDGKPYDYGFSIIPLHDKQEDGNELRRFIKYNENNFLIAETADKFIAKIKNVDGIALESTNRDVISVSNENVKGVCSFSPLLLDADEDANEIYYVNFYISNELKTELRKHVKGFFFVRQTRIPSVIALGITIGIDNESRTPTIPTAGGVLSMLGDNLEKTHVQTENINGINYISEGFLKRYSFSFKKKSSSFWGKIGKVMGVAALVVGAVAASLYTGGASFMFLGAIGNITGAIAGIVPAATGVLGAAIATGIVAGAAGAVAGAVITSVAASTQELGYAVVRIGAKKKLDGKNTKAPSGYKIVEEEDSRKITEVFEDRIIIKDDSKNKIQGIICPDYSINQAYYNQVFTGNEHLVKTDDRQSNVIEEYSGECYFTNNDRHFYIDKYKNVTIKSSTIAKIIGVPDNAKCVGINNVLFKARAGEAEEAWRYSYIGNDTTNDDNDAKKINTDIIRGSYSPYLAFLNTAIGPTKIVNIYAPGYDETLLQDYIEIRMNDNSVYNAITDRYSFTDSDYGLEGDPTVIGNVYSAYRGDCYICLYTLRIIRNFNDPSAPYNDTIVDENTWKENYDPDDTEKYQEINLGDVNAVPLGMWVTFQLRSSNNLNIRTLDGSDVDEAAMTGNPRGYYPIQPMSVNGTYKKPESQIYNKGFCKSISERWNFEVPDVPYIKNWFGTRIMYSDIHINDGYKNGFRVFRGTNYRDYTREYGEIVKLISLESNLLCVFEHGIALIPVNERAVAGQGAGGNVYINTSNVLPENPKIISDMFGSQWPESVLKVPGKTGDAAQYVYGVDTVAKKIWRTDGNTLECISDFKVQEFLNNNITLGERELTPKIGIRNVKTLYNAYKRDVMFTFYDNTYGFEEKVWNLCWNELLLKFVTFYSWVPSYMENINNIPFSFDRNVSKWIAKLGVSHSNSSFADGITLSNVLLNIENDKYTVDNHLVTISYITKSGKHKTFKENVPKQNNLIGVLLLKGLVLPDETLFYNVSYTLEQDQFLNYKNFYINPKDEPLMEVSLPDDALFAGNTIKLYGLFYANTGISTSGVYYKDASGLLLEVYAIVKESFSSIGVKSNAMCSELYYRNLEGHVYADYDTNKIGGDGNIYFDKPIFKNIKGQRPTLPNNLLINPDKLVTLLNIKATIEILDLNNTSIPDLSDSYYNIKAGYTAGLYESTVAITPKWNLQFLTSDFWKHGQAGIIDIADDIFPTYWYGKQHPFEFEVVVVNDPSVHKIFSNLEIVANKAKPESFHYEIIGESYDFAKDKPNMYFRLEAKKALWLYNGSDITYNRNFLKTQPRQQAKSADFPHKYYYRLDKINEVEDYYNTITLPNNSKYSYKHLSGAEIVYYPNRQEYRIWQHTPAIDMDDSSYRVSYSNSGCRGLIEGNMRYLEDRWKVTINPILICYKNEGKTWLGRSSWTSRNRPPLTIMNSPIPDDALETIDENNQEIVIPDELWDLGYTYNDMDTTNWLNDVSVYGANFGEAQNRKELDLKDKFMKVRIRYSGEELAVIDFLNTVYRISYA